MSKEVIPLIHNYCNRWCERCPLGHRCAIFDAHDQRSEGATEFWQNIRDSLSEVRQKLEIALEELGLDPEEIANEPIEETRMSPQQMRENFPLLKLASKTGERMARLVEKMRPLLKDEQDSFLNISELDLPTLKEERFLLRVQNALDILCWYRFFIEVKLSRALQGRAYEEGDLIQNDYNGSAKIARIAVQHCLNAGHIILNDLPEVEQECLEMLVPLQRLQGCIDDEFPNAQRFIRPGFDTLQIGENLGV